MIVDSEFEGAVSKELFNFKITREERVEILQAALRGRSLGVSRLAEIVGLPVSTVFVTLKSFPELFYQDKDKFWHLAETGVSEWPFEGFDTIARVEKQLDAMDRILNLDSPESLGELLKLKKLYEGYRKELLIRLSIIDLKAQEISKKHFGGSKK